MDKANADAQGFDLRNQHGRDIGAAD